MAYSDDSDSDDGIGVICDLCESHSMESGTDVVLMIRGQILVDAEGGYLFVPEPQAELAVEQMPNDQIAMKVVPSHDIHVAEALCMNVYMEDRKGARPEAATQEVMIEERWN